MSKSRYHPDEKLYQIVVRLFNQRRLAPVEVRQSGQVWKSDHNIDDIIPERTILRRAKTSKCAIKSASKIGSVLSCRKVSHEYRLRMIDHLNIETKPVEVDISPEEFIIGRDLEIKTSSKIKKIDVNGT